MSFLTAIMSFLGGPLLDKIVGPLTDCYKAYLNKQISEAQLREQIQAILVQAFQAIEIEHAEVLSKTYATFMQTAQQSPLLQAVWAAVTLSQLSVLLWSQVGVPLAYSFDLLPKGWHAGTTADWSYLLVGACVGLGPMVLRAGPGAGGGIGQTLKNMIGK